MMGEDILELLDEPVKVLGLSSRTYNCLMRSGIESIGDLVNMSEEDLLFNIRNFGSGSLLDTKQCLEKFNPNLHLGMKDEIESSPYFEKHIEELNKENQILVEQLEKKKELLRTINELLDENHRLKENITWLDEQIEKLSMQSENDNGVYVLVK